MYKTILRNSKQKILLPVSIEKKFKCLAIYNETCKDLKVFKTRLLQKYYKGEFLKKSTLKKI